MPGSVRQRARSASVAVGCRLSRLSLIQASDGVYEYAGESLELNLQRSRMEGLEDDVYRGELKAIRK